MTVRLIKRKDMLARSEKQAQPPSTNQLALTTQGWIEEFRAQKARDRRSLSGLMKRD
jgi:hypothetical protein